jgi:hypothetical protein
MNVLPREVLVRISASSPLTCLIVMLAMLSLAGCGGSSSTSNSGGGGGGQTPTVTIAAFPSQIGSGANWQFSATATGTSGNQGVNWAVTTQNGGTIDSSGLYIAPTTGSFPLNVTVSVTSQANSAATASANITITQTDPLGTAQGTSITCPTFGGGLPNSSSTCYQINTSCPGVADFSVYLKVNQPTGTPLGTVMFGTGTGGTQLYDFDEPDFFSGSTNGGLSVVQSVLDAGFTTVQVSFGSPFNDQTPNGWLTGPGGVRRLACRYATTAQWVYQNIHNANASAPLCATGNSGGSGAIAYALTDYGLNSIFSMVEETSGPPMSRLDEACVPPSNSICQKQQFTCNPGDPAEGLSVCYSTEEAGIVDTAYSTPMCSNAINGTAPPAGLFLSDSILGGQPPTFPSTSVNVLLGGQDLTSAPEQGLLWENALTNTTKSQACVTDAPHPIPSVADGASTIATDIQNLCKLQ